MQLADKTNNKINKPLHLLVFIPPSVSVPDDSGDLNDTNRSQAVLSKCTWRGKEPDTTTYRCE